MRNIITHNRTTLILRNLLSHLLLPTFQMLHQQNQKRAQATHVDCSTDVATLDKKVRQPENRPACNSMLAIAAGLVLIWKFVFLL